MSAYAYLIGWRIVRYLPESLAQKIFALLGDYVYRKNGKGINRLRNNLQLVTNSDGTALDSLTKAAMRSYMRYWCDTFRLPDWPKTRIQNTVELVNGEALTDPLDAGRSAHRACKCRTRAVAAGYECAGAGRYGLRAALRTAAAAGGGGAAAVLCAAAVLHGAVADLLSFGSRDPMAGSGRFADFPRAGPNCIYMRRSSDASMPLII